MARSPDQSEIVQQDLFEDKLHNENSVCDLSTVIPQTTQSLMKFLSFLESRLAWNGKDGETMALGKETGSYQ